MYAIQKFEVWTNESEWNFRNKYLLLQAENHFSSGELCKAEVEYKLAILFAHDHRFVHEEAVACELAGNFHLEMNRKDHSLCLLKQAVNCYIKWGAHRKADDLLQFIDEITIGRI